MRSRWWRSGRNTACRHVERIESLRSSLVLLSCCRATEIAHPRLPPRVVARTLDAGPHSTDGPHSPEKTPRAVAGFACGAARETPLIASCLRRCAARRQAAGVTRLERRGRAAWRIPHGTALDRKAARKARCR